MAGDKRAIIDLAVAVPRSFLRLEALAQARGEDPARYLKGLGCREMALCRPGEDVITLGAEAGSRLLEGYPEGRKRVGLCVAGTESAVDGSKPAAIYFHRLLGLRPSCRVFEVKHACYSGTAALQVALDWSSQHPQELALVIMSDVARYERNSPGEPTQGAGAVALLVGYVPEEEVLLSLSEPTGLYAEEVSDFWRPSYSTVAEVRGKFSIACYLRGLAAAYEDYLDKSGEQEEPDYSLFHVPFPKMAQKAHRHLCQHLGIKDPGQQEADFLRRVEPGLWANRRVGNIYAGSLYLMLAGLLEREGQALAGKKVALFSYGSGSCSEYFTGRFGPHLPRPCLRELFAGRQEMTVERYEAFSKETLALEKNQSYFHPISPLQQTFTFLGIRDHERIYHRCHAEKENVAEERTETRSTRFNAAHSAFHYVNV